MSFFDINVFGTDEDQTAWESFLKRWLKDQINKKEMREKRTYWMLGFRKNCCKILMSREIWEKPCQKLSERVCEQYLGMPKREMIKERWQLPAGLDQVWQNKHKANGKQCVLLSPLRGFKSAVASWQGEAGLQPLRVTQKPPEKMEKESLEEWARSLMWCGYHRDHSPR